MRCWSIIGRGLGIDCRCGAGALAFTGKYITPVCHGRNDLETPEMFISSCFFLPSLLSFFRLLWICGVTVGLDWGTKIDVEMLVEKLSTFEHVNRQLCSKERT